MTTTSFSGPVRAGDKRLGEGAFSPNQGFVDLQQTVALTQNSTTPVDVTFYVPLGAKINSFLVDVLTAFNSASSAILSVGKTAGGTEYVSGVDVKAAAGRIAITYTAAQLAQMANVSVLGVALTPGNQNQQLVVRVTPTGATSAGYVRVTCVYSQLPNPQNALLGQ